MNARMEERRLEAGFDCGWWRMMAASAAVGSALWAALWVLIRWALEAV